MFSEVIVQKENNTLCFILGFTSPGVAKLANFTRKFKFIDEFYFVSKRAV